MGACTTAPVLQPAQHSLPLAESQVNLSSLMQASAPLAEAPVIQAHTIVQTAPVISQPYQPAPAAPVAVVQAPIQSSAIQEEKMSYFHHQEPMVEIKQEEPKVIETFESLAPPMPPTSHTAGIEDPWVTHQKDSISIHAEVNFNEAPIVEESEDDRERLDFLIQAKKIAQDLGFKNSNDDDLEIPAFLRRGINSEK
jgi:hypothetical protein